MSATIEPIYLSDDDRGVIARLREAELRANVGLDPALDWNDVRHVRLLIERAVFEATPSAQANLRDRAEEAEEKADDLRRQVDEQAARIRSLCLANAEQDEMIRRVRKALRKPRKGPCK